MRARVSAVLVALAAAAGCTDSPKTQVVTGTITTRNALAVRAVTDGNVVTAARVRSDGSFTLSLPRGAKYELQVLTATGVQHVLDARFTALAFRVCAPTDPFDLGGLGHGMGSGGCTTPPGMCDPNGGSNCPPPPMCDPNGGSNCPPPPDCDPSTGSNCPPPMCDPSTDPNCLPPPMCDPAGGSNCPPPPDCDPSTGSNCPPPMCDPSTDPNCPPPPGCDPATGANCPPPMCDPTTDPNCLPPMCDASGNCAPPCDPMMQADCPTPPPPCADPTDPQTCQDPCMGDPMQCGCDPSGSANSCWPPPPDCDASGMCGGMMPDHLPGDFGCGS